MCVILGVRYVNMILIIILIITDYLWRPIRINNRNNNIICGAPFVKARSAYKDIRIRSFHHTRARARTPITQTLTHTHTYAHTHSHTRTHTRGTHTQTHTHTHTYTHTPLFQNQNRNIYCPITSLQGHIQGITVYESSE